jgi:hypothetical protein
MRRQSSVVALHAVPAHKESTMTNQPNWVLVANLGDASPLDYGGYFVYRDTTGVYPAEAEKIFVSDDTDDPDYPGQCTIHRITLDRCKEVHLGDQIYLVPFNFNETWPFPVSEYDEWFHVHLDRVAENIGVPVQEVRDFLCSESECSRALAYEAIYDYHGWENGDCYPLHMSHEEAKARYETKNTL